MNSKQYKHHQATLPGTEIGVRVLKGKDSRSDIERALRNWKKQVKDANILPKLKDRMQYEKPAVTRRKAKKRAKYLAKLTQE